MHHGGEGKWLRCWPVGGAMTPRVVAFIVVVALFTLAVIEGIAALVFHHPMSGDRLGLAAVLVPTMAVLGMSKYPELCRYLNKRLTRQS